MRPRRSGLDYLRDILQATTDALAFIEGLDFTTFCRDRRTNLAVIRSLEIIGEASRHIPASVRHSHPEVPWQDMADMRNKLIHEYFGVDLNVLWRTVLEDMPPLSEAIKRILEGMAKDGDDL